MPYFNLSSQIRQEVGHFIKLAKIKGSDASKLVEVVGLITQRENYPYVSLSEDQNKFLLDVLGNLEIKGDHALVMTQVMLSLSKPLKEIPKGAKGAKKKVKKTGKM